MIRQSELSQKRALYRSVVWVVFPSTSILLLLALFMDAHLCNQIVFSFVFFVLAATCSTRLTFGIETVFLQSVSEVVDILLPFFQTVLLHRCDEISDEAVKILLKHCPVSLYNLFKLLQNSFERITVFVCSYGFGSWNSD